MQAPLSKRIRAILANKTQTKSLIEALQTKSADGTFVVDDKKIRLERVAISERK